MQKILNRTHKNLMLFEASYVYMKRHSIRMSIDDFIEKVYLNEDFKGDIEFEAISKDIRNFRVRDSYVLSEITEAEYDDCYDNFEMCID